MITDEREQEQYFTGGYRVEVDAVSDLDARLGEKYFQVFREVEGYYMSKRPWRDDKSPRIDRILVPKAPLRDLGWTQTIGVEAKRAGEKLGPAVAQAIDYTWAIFRCGATYLYPEYIFLWHLNQQHGAIASVMVQNRIGHLYTTRTQSLVFVLERQVLALGLDGSIEVKAMPVAGRKVGSR